MCEYNKLAQKEYKISYNWVGKENYKELYKTRKFDRIPKYAQIKIHGRKWDIKFSGILKYKRMTDFRSEDQINDKNFLFCGFCRSDWLQNENKRNQNDWQILGSG